MKEKEKKKENSVEKKRESPKNIRITMKNKKKIEMFRNQNSATK